MFDDAFGALAQVPEFFAALARDAVTLDDVRDILEGLGAADETERKTPGAPCGRRESALAAAAELASVPADVLAQAVAALSPEKRAVLRRAAGGQEAPGDRA